MMSTACHLPFLEKYKKLQDSARSYEDFLVIFILALEHYLGAATLEAEFWSILTDKFDANQIYTGLTGDFRVHGPSPVLHGALQLPGLTITLIDRKDSIKDFVRGYRFMLDAHYFPFLAALRVARLVTKENSEPSNEKKYCAKKELTIILQRHFPALTITTLFSIVSSDLFSPKDEKGGSSDLSEQPSFINWVMAHQNNLDQSEEAILPELHY